MKNIVTKVCDNAVTYGLYVSVPVALFGGFAMIIFQNPSEFFIRIYLIIMSVSLGVIIGSTYVKTRVNAELKRGATNEIL